MENFDFGSQLTTKKEQIRKEPVGSIMTPKVLVQVVPLLLNSKQKRKYTQVFPATSTNSRVYSMHGL